MDIMTEALGNNRIVDSDTILKKLFGDYYSSYVLDVEKDMISEIKPSLAISEKIGANVFSWSGEMENLIEALADPNYHEMLRSFMRLEHIAIAFKESQAPKEFLFKKSTGVWRRAFVAPIEMNGGFTRRALLLFNSDFTKESGEGVTRKAVPEKKGSASGENSTAAKLMKCVYQSYGSLYEIDVEKDYYTTLYMNPWIKKKPMPEEGVYSQVNLTACDGFVKPEYLEKRIKIGELPYLVETLQKKRKIEYEFETVAPEAPWLRVEFLATEKNSMGKPTKISMSHFLVDADRKADE